MYPPILDFPEKKGDVAQALESSPTFLVFFILVIGDRNKVNGVFITHFPKRKKDKELCF